MFVLLAPDILIPELGTAIFINNYEDKGIFPTMSLRSTYALGIIYSVFFHYLFRATPGKLIFNLRLTTINPDVNLSIIKLFIRELVKNLIITISLVSIFFTKGEIALHDYMTETKVVEKFKANPFNRPNKKQIFIVSIVAFALCIITLSWDLISYFSQIE